MAIKCKLTESLKMDVSLLQVIIKDTIIITITIDIINNILTAIIIFSYGKGSCAGCEA